MFDELDTTFDDINFEDLDDEPIEGFESADADADFDAEIAAIESELGLDLEDPVFEGAEDGSDDTLTEAVEAAIFMDTVRESFDNDADFVHYVMENAVEWELFGLIPSASRALEAVKTLKIDDWKAKNRQRLIRRECIRIACKKGDPLYEKYKKYRDLMRQYRTKIFEKYETKAKSNVMKARNNSSVKAANINTASGKDLKKRVDTSKQVSEKGNDPTNAPKKSKAS